MQENRCDIIFGRNLLGPAFCLFLNHEVFNEHRMKVKIKQKAEKKNFGRDLNSVART